MDCAPLNLAHLHERRAEKLLKQQLYDNAYEAIETSLQYLQRYYDKVKIPKSKEVLRIQQWDFERKLKQIVHKQHSDQKYTERVQQLLSQYMDKESSAISHATTASSVGPNTSIAQASDSVVTIMRLSSEYTNLNTAKFKFGIKSSYNDKADDKLAITIFNCNILTIPQPAPTETVLHNKSQIVSCQIRCENVCSNDCHNRDSSVVYNAEATTTCKDDDLPLLAPLELPIFDYNVFLTAKLVENM